MRFAYSGPSLQFGFLLYRCEICNKCFADNSNLTKHKKIHLAMKAIKDIKPQSKDIASGDGELKYNII